MRVTLGTGEERHQFQFVVRLSHFLRDFFERVEFAVRGIHVILVNLKIFKEMQLSCAVGWKKINKQK